MNELLSGLITLFLCFDRSLGERIDFFLFLWESPLLLLCGQGPVCMGCDIPDALPCLEK